MSDDLVKRLRERPLRGGGESNDEFAIRRQKEREDGADLIEAQAARIAKLEAALHKIADRTKRAHPQTQEGEIHQIAITVLTNNTQENINDINE